MTYDQKVSQAHSLIKSALENSRNPAVMCSFGKDSIVVLHMVMDAATVPPITLGTHAAIDSASFAVTWHQ